MSDDSTRDDVPSPSVLEAVREDTPDEGGSDDPGGDDLPSPYTLDAFTEDDAPEEAIFGDATNDDLPSPYILEAFKKQDTPELYRAAVTSAEENVRFLRRCGVAVAPREAHAMVNTARGGICIGDVTWNPDRVPLLKRICLVMRQQTWNQVRRSRHYVHLSIDVDEYDADDADRLIGGARDSRAPDDVVVALLTHVVAELQTIAPDNHHVRAVLGCWRDLVVTQEAITARTGITAAACRAARQTLIRLASKLDPDVLKNARDVLRDLP